MYSFRKRKKEINVHIGNNILFRVDTIFFSTYIEAVRAKVSYDSCRWLDLGV